MSISLLICTQKIIPMRGRNLRWVNQKLHFGLQNSYLIFISQSETILIIKFGMISRNNFCLAEDNQKVLTLSVGWMDGQDLLLLRRIVPTRLVWQARLTSAVFVEHSPCSYMHLQLFRQLLVLQLAAETRNRKSALHWNVAQAEFFFILSGGFWIFFPSFTQTPSSKKHLIFGMCLKCSIKIRIMRQTANCISQNAKCEMQREKREIKTSSVRIRNVH